MRIPSPAVIAVLVLGAMSVIADAAVAQVPPGATARCNDGTYWTAPARQGACSGHGGVTQWLIPADANALCSDGTYESGPRRGACSRHGGVAEWLVPPTATARCEDGTYHLGANRRGACTGAGGVAEWLTAAAATGGTIDWRAELKRDAVAVTGNRMTIDETNLVKVAVPGYQTAQIQLKVHAEAPASGVISRDNFVAMATQLMFITFYSAYAQAYKVTALDFLQAVTFTELAAPIGTPDVEINVVMTAEGFQLEWVDTASGQRSRSTMTWAEMYAQ